MKKTLRRIAAAAMCGATVFALAACGGGGNKNNSSSKTEANGEITVKLLDTGIGKDFLNDIADEFYNETKINVKITNGVLVDKQLSEGMKTGDVSEDIYMTCLTYDWIDWVAADTIEDLTTLCDEKYDNGLSINDKIADSIKDLGKIGDHRYIIQFTYCPTGIVYNQDMLDDLFNKGIAKSKEFPTKWSDLVELVKAVSSADYRYNGNKVYGMVWGDSDQDLMDTFKTLWAQNDYEAYQNYFRQEENLNTDLFINDARRKALEALYDLIDPVNGKSSTSVPNMLTTSHTDAYRDFINGDALMCFAGSWFETETSGIRDESTFNYRFAAVPAIGDNEISVNINYPTEYFFIPKNSENTEKAKQFLQFMFREDNLVKMHNALQTPLAFKYETSSLELTDWGKDVQSVMKYKHTVSGSTSLYYLIGGLRPEIEGKVFTEIYNGSVNKNQLSSLLQSDYSQKAGGNWQDTVDLVQTYTAKFTQKGLLK